MRAVLIKGPKDPRYWRTDFFVSLFVLFIFVCVSSTSISWSVPGQMKLKGWHIFTMSGVSGACRGAPASFLSPRCGRAEAPGRIKVTNRRSALPFDFYSVALFRATIQSLSLQFAGTNCGCDLLTCSKLGSTQHDPDISSSWIGKHLVGWAIPRPVTPRAWMRNNCNFQLQLQVITTLLSNFNFWL